MAVRSSSQSSSSDEPNSTRRPYSSAPRRPTKNSCTCWTTSSTLHEQGRRRRESIRLVIEEMYAVTDSLSMFPTPWPSNAGAEAEGERRHRKLRWAAWQGLFRSADQNLPLGGHKQQRYYRMNPSYWRSSFDPIDNSKEARFRPVRCSSIAFSRISRQTPHLRA